MAASCEDAIGDRSLTPYEARCTDSDHGRILREMLDRIGDKWSLLVVGTLHHGTLRFGELLGHIPGLSQRMLTRTLRGLERDGIVARTVYAEVPPRVEYELTGLGRDLVPAAEALASWMLDNYDEIRAARERFDARSPAKGS